MSPCCTTPLLHMNDKDIYYLPNCQMASLRGNRTEDCFGSQDASPPILPSPRPDANGTGVLRNSAADMPPVVAVWESRHSPPFSPAAFPRRAGTFPVVLLHVLPACMYDARSCCHVSYTVISPKEHLHTWRRLCHLECLPEMTICQEPCTAISAQRHPESCSRYPP